MRIIHLSDIHLSSNNIEDLKLYYLDCLISDLRKQSQSQNKPIDLIIISGDLVDKGGESLLKLTEYKAFNNPFEIFEKEFISPLIEKLPIVKEQILFTSGNHDIQSNKINEIIEAGLNSILTNSVETNRICKDYRDTEYLNFDKIEKFLDFEKKYHTKSIENENYNFTNFESTFIYKFNGINIGIMLANDSWRCTKNGVKNHFMGSYQFLRALQIFENNNTAFNIAVMHHPLEKFSTDEKNNIENILKSKKIQILLNGHEHSSRITILGYDPNKSLTISGRSAFDKPHEKEIEYISGYSIIDIDIKNENISTTFRRYYKNRYVFDNDLENEPPLDLYSYGRNINNATLKKIDLSKKDFKKDFKKENFINSSEDEA